MIQLGPRHFLAQTAADLPPPRPGEPVYMDCETRSRDESGRTGGNQAYLGDLACMWGVCFDDDGPAIAVPYRLRNSSANLPEEAVRRWLKDVVSAAGVWRNHNVKFDAHFAHVDGAFDGRTPLACTLTLAKGLDSDRWSHDLKALMREWLHYDTAAEDKVRAWLDGYKLPRRAKANDYALVPADLLGFYCCDDVLGTRELYAHCMREMPPEIHPTWEMEQQLTSVLWDMENAGLKVDPKELQVARLKTLHRQIKLATRINELTGTEYADSSSYSFSLLVGAWGLPVLSRDKKSGNPSFDADALKLYLVHPEVITQPKRAETIETMLALRKEETYSSLFVDKFIESADPRGFVHSSYNQVVRTGRMSCKDPNTQQFDDRAKQLVIADGPGMGFADYDYSQIEFRFIVHYIRDQEAIDAYCSDPATDFHEYVAKSVRIKRKPAKTINFSTAFGAGKRNIVGQLAANEDVILEVTQQVNDMIARGELDERKRLDAFAKLCWKRGEETYNAYHDRFSTLKPTAEDVAKVCRARGFVFNVYGRRRHLPTRAAHVAFNTLCQGGAMDLIKRRMIMTAPRNWPELRAAGITQRANIHDAIVFHGPVDALREMDMQIRERLQTPEPRLSVPVYVSSNITEGRWSHG